MRVQQNRSRKQGQGQSEQPHRVCSSWSSAACLLVKVHQVRALLSSCCCCRVAVPQRLSIHTGLLRPIQHTLLPACLGWAAALVLWEVIHSA